MKKGKEGMNEIKASFTLIWCAPRSVWVPCSVPVVFMWATCSLP